MKGKVIPVGLKWEKKPRSGEGTTHKPHWFQGAIIGSNGALDPEGPKGQLPVTPTCILCSHSKEMK
jgi:hypothetical protein